jgi:glutamyl-tRNA reductase
MTEILILGLNHKTADVDLRECLAFSDDQVDTALQALRAQPSISEVVLLSTCNRVEIIFATKNPDKALTEVKHFLSQFKNVPADRFEKALYLHRGDQAVKHIFRVAASLDSMMVGEPQILGQVKEAYRIATEQKTSGVILNRLLHKTFFVAKRIRTETGIGNSAVSISYAAIELGRKIFGSLEGKKALLIGAGEMAELAVEHLLRYQVVEIYVANRTFERAVELAGQFKGQPVKFEEIPDILPLVDIVISSTGAPDYVVTRPQIKPIMKERRNRPVFFIDIAVPRDIDPELNRLTNVYVYDIDDLNGIVDENVEDRNREALKGERIVDETAIHFRRWLENLSVVPTIKALREKMEKITRAELDKTKGNQKFSPEQEAAIERMAAALVNKILHDPTLMLKSEGCYADKSQHIDLTRKLFKLDNNQ